MTVKVLFVCLGNICRSPLAQGIFDDLCRQKNITHLVESDSAGTIGMHSGSSPDPRALNIARKNGLSFLTKHVRLKLLTSAVSTTFW